VKKKNFYQPLLLAPDLGRGLPDFSWYKKTKWQCIYQIATNYSTRFHPKAFQKGVFGMQIYHLATLPGTSIL
jgi:hypothetical protein